MGEGLSCLIYPEVLGPGHRNTQFTDLPQMCALCSPTPLAFTPAWSDDEGFQLEEQSSRP